MSGSGAAHVEAWGRRDSKACELLGAGNVVDDPERECETSRYVGKHQTVLPAICRIVDQVLSVGRVKDGVARMCEVWRARRPGLGDAGVFVSGGGGDSDGATVVGGLVSGAPLVAVRSS